MRRRTANPIAPASAGATVTTGASRAGVEIDARAAARELRVLRRPQTRSRAFGGPGVRRDEMSWRRNIPRPVTPGAYRDVAVRRRVAARLRGGSPRSIGDGES